MQIFFESRTAQRSFAKKEGRKAVDNGSNATKGRRWGVELSSVKKRNLQSGFTLIELLIVLVIVAFIGVLVWDAVSR